VEEKVNLVKLLFPYRAHLEKQIEELKAEKDALLNRLLHAYSGYELKQPVPSYAEVNGKVPSLPETDTVMGKGTHSTLDLLEELENETLRRSEGIDDITVKAARDAAIRENQEAAAEYERNMIKMKAKAAAESGVKEYV
jgi:hypothetical protein